MKFTNLLMLPCECGNKRFFALPRECEMQAMDPTAHKTGSKRLCDGGDDDYVLIATMVLMVLI